MNRIRNPLRALSCAVALAVALPGLALAGDNDKTMRQRVDVTAERAGQSAADARREAVIWTTYATNQNLRANDIDVEVKSGTAILSGTVESDVEKNLAEQLAKNVNGVNRVDNRLKVDANYRPVARRDGTERDFGTFVSDATITAQVKSKLLWNTNTDGLQIDVDTMNGRVSLTGTADTKAARDLAGRLASNTQGVVAVDNKLTIDPDRAVARRIDPDRPVAGTDRAATDADRRADRTVARTDTDQPADGWISTKVKSTLLFSRSVDGLDIDVDTKQGVVALKGTVDSDAERQAAVELARDIKGVRRVDASGLRIEAAAVADRDDDLND
jgi:hyperosmotically inducible periplasmic protein